MNKFLQKVFVDNANYYRPEESPLINGIKLHETIDYSPLQHQTLYRCVLECKTDMWISGNQENNKHAIQQLRDLVVKRLHHEIYGDVESYLHELLVYLHNKDWERCHKMVELIKLAIKVPG